MPQVKLHWFFVFQAEDGIRDHCVTGVQTCALPIFAMVVDDLVACGAEPLFLLDYIACGEVVPERVAEIGAGIADGCRYAGCSLLGGETAEHPGVMRPDEYDISGTGVGVVEE